MQTRIVSSRFSAWFLLIFVFYIAAASSFGGYFLKWNFRENTPFSLPLALDGTESRPFVYRQLLPMTANLIDAALPEKLKDALLHKLVEDPPLSNPVQRYFPGATDVTRPQYSVRYLLVYAMTFLSMFAALFVIRAVCLELLGDPVAATLAPIAIAGVFPLILTEGGYYYDMPELLFMALGIRLVLKRHLAALVVVVALATLNKESYLFFVLMLFPFAAMHYTRRQALLLTGGLVAVAVAVNLAVKHRYMGNDGGMVAYQLVSHVLFLINPLHYFRTEINYGVPTTKGFNVVHLVLLGIVVKLGWRGLPAPARMATLISLGVNVPLFLAFCFKDELRNLSLLIMPLALLISATISALLAQRALPAREPQPAARKKKGVAIATPSCVPRRRIDVPTT